MVLSTSYNIKAWTVLTFWSVFFVYDMVYRHYHYDNNGNLISHVHLYDKSSGDHNHSDDDFHWLDQISNYVSLIEEPFIVGEYIFSTSISSVLVSDYTLVFLHGCIHSFYLRGPPQLV